MRLSLFISFIVSFLLSACASSAAYEQQMQRWRGKNIQILRQQWGTPDAAIKLANGHVLYQYTQKNFFTIPASKRQPLQTNNTLFTSYEKPWLNNNQTMVRYCRSTFETDKKGNIIRTSFNGNNCLAYQFSR